MSVVTISRGTMSGGKAIAEKLAEVLEYRCVDRDEIVKKASTSGVSEDELRDALTKAPTFLDRFQHKKYIYLALIQSALVEEVRMGKVVYHGNAGHLLLHGAGPILRVRIIAPMEFRIAMAEEHLNLDRNRAISYIEKMDEARRKWAQFLYGVDWADPSLYQLVVNLDGMDVNEVTNGVGQFIRAQTCFRFDDCCQAMMDDLAVASQVKVDLALDEITSHLEFEVTSKDGVVTLRGKVNDVKLVGHIREVASKATGVKEVLLDQLLAPTQA
jgi:cytidylate kinase